MTQHAAVHKKKAKKKSLANDIEKSWSISRGGIFNCTREKDDIVSLASFMGGQVSFLS